jgi:hypothetical protein
VEEAVEVMKKRWDGGLQSGEQGADGWAGLERRSESCGWERSGGKVGRDATEVGVRNGITMVEVERRAAPIRN